MWGAGKMPEVFCYLSGFFTGVGVTCTAFCIYLHRLQKEVAEIRKKLEVVEELERRR